MLKVKNLSKNVNHRPILHNVHFAIPRGEVAIILGGSGAGKSTFMRVLSKLETCDTGIIELDHVLLDQAQHVGMVFQQFHLFENLTARGNIMSALVHAKKMNKREAAQIADRLLQRYGLDDKGDLHVGNLSGGQKQRLAIARTLAIDPKIVCLDEPTSALDPRLTQQVAGYINDLAKEGRIVLVTTHDMGLVDALNGHLFLMEKGTFVETAHQSRFRARPHDYPRLKEFLGG